MRVWKNTVYSGREEKKKMKRDQLSQSHGTEEARIQKILFYSVHVSFTPLLVDTSVNEF